MSHDEYFGHAAIYAWWFILFLSINPVRQRFISQTGRKEETAAPPESEEQDQGTE